MAGVEGVKQTPFKKVNGSPIGQLIKDNPIATTGAVAATALVVAGGAAKSEAFKKVAEKGIVPAAGAAGSLYGVSMVHDAIVNDLGKSNGKAAGKTAAGTLLALGGAEIVGRSYDIKGLNQALSGPVEFLVKNHKWTGTALASGASIAGGATVVSGVKDLAEGEKLKGGAKVVGGGLVALGGAEVVGRIHDIPVLKEVLSKPAAKIAERGQSILGVGVAGGGVAAGTFAYNRFKKAANGENTAVNAALGVGSTLTSAAAVLGGAELVGRDLGIKGVDQALTGTVKAIAKNGVGATAAGTLLIAGGGVLGSEAVKNFKKGGNDLITTAEAMGAVTAAAGGLELIGKGTGYKPLQGLLTEHAGVVGGTAVTALGAALTRVSVKDMQKKGLTELNAAGTTLGAAAIPGGVGIAAATLGAEKVALNLGKTSLAIGGVGLGAITYKWGKETVESFKKGEQLKGVGYGVAAVNAGIASSWAIGTATGIKPLTQVGEYVSKYTVTPIWEKAIVPSARYLYNNPVAGAAITLAAVGGGAYWYFKNKKD
ncbi:MAG: hypothetical protein FJZ00_07100 [Candidatus Sericytochromatia bacterium]|uniref:Uncharacterized protein n=1 Tax=Candidatus Tanganyikabacteria bacterium TaxID=2961651 RepID=A0A937X5X4_9BACT|nr:hypothetical protein [Candidatus Tanganyikabacteria bacterium]